MKFFAKRDTIILMGLWNLILTGAIIFLLFFTFAILDQANDEVGSSARSFEEIYSRIYELERRAGIDHLNPEQATTSGEDTYLKLQERLDVLEAKVED